MEELRKKIYELNRWWIDIGCNEKTPPPPPLPHYDPKEEAPKWDWARLYWRLPPAEIRTDIPKRGGVAKSDDTPDWRGVIKNNVIPGEQITKYDFGQPEYPGYYWFDTPDYADPFKKLWYSFKIHLKIGVGLACTSAICQGKEFNYATNKFLFRSWVLPIVAGGMAASVTVITLANLRGKKDDYWNYFAGAMVAALVTGRPTVNYVRHLQHSFAWGISAISVKYMNENNGVIVPRVNWRLKNLGISGHNAQEGFTSGEFMVLRGSRGDPGRDVRRFPG